MILDKSTILTTYHHFDVFVDTFARHPIVSDACRDLSKHHKLNPTLLMFCCWLGFSGRGRLRPSEINEAIALINQWRSNVTRPLKKIKNSLDKHSHQDTQMLNAQLSEHAGNAELIEQRIVSETIVKPVKKDRSHLERYMDALVNLSSYVNRLHIQFNDETEPCLFRLLSLFFTQIEPYDYASLYAPTKAIGAPKPVKRLNSPENEDPPSKNATE